MQIKHSLRLKIRKGFPDNPKNLDFGVVLVTKGYWELMFVQAFKDHEEKAKIIKIANSYVTSIRKNHTYTHQVSVHYGVKIKDVLGI